ncbi:hypothetical protein PKOR_01955 [Pontibacter korlensis]|uniref:Uncharacterized protein n=2 Tax=Pontibacter korlensis TaxID=400092 RepID=A0A0E3UVS9_9BACT|nr:hypothetical protein PKOR_01955 [Pontibacter korlensis]
MITSLYLKYRKKEEHLLSAFWAKLFLAFLATCFIFVPIRILIERAPLHWQCFFDDYLIVLVFLVWGAMVALLHLRTIKYSTLADIELRADEYSKGINIVIICSVTCIILTCTVMYVMGPTGAGC